MSSLQPKLVPSSTFETRSSNGLDLTEDDFAWKIAFHAAQRFFNFDLSKVTFCGLADDVSAKESGIKVIVVGAQGVVRDVFIALPCNATVMVHLNDGVGVEEALGIDTLGAFEKLWLAARGFPEGYPCGMEANVTREGALEVAVAPLG